MKFIGLASGDQAVRGWWRLVLSPKVFANPFGTWSEKVDDWRTRVAAGEAQVATTVSTASITDPSIIVGIRAIVDVQILGADTGETVGAIAFRLGAIGGSVDVDSVTAIENSDPVARDAALQDASNTADPFGLKGLFDKLGIGITVILVVAVGVVVYKLVKEARK